MTRSVGSSSRKAMVADIVTTATAKDNVPSGPPTPGKIRAENQTAVMLFFLTYLS
jgi:hypothetical protein